jgi:hypothetical protein
MASVRLHIKGHCIETAAKKEFKRLMDAYFAGEDAGPDLEARIELLRDFIETGDFAALRSSDPRFSGEVEARVLLAREEGAIRVVPL